MVKIPRFQYNMKQGLLNLPHQFDFSPKYQEGKSYLGWTPKETVKLTGVGTQKVSRSLTFTNPQYPTSKIMYSDKPWQPMEIDTSIPHRRITPSDVVKPLNMFSKGGDKGVVVNMTGGQIEYINGEFEPNPNKPTLFGGTMPAIKVAATHYLVNKEIFPETKTRSLIQTKSSVTSDSTRDISHELGHRLESMLTPKEHDEWSKLSKKKTEGIPQASAFGISEPQRSFAPSKYGSTTGSEDFAESFAEYQRGNFDRFYGKKLKEINDKIKAIHERKSGAPETPRDVILYTTKDSLPKLEKLKHRLQEEASGRKRILQSVTSREGVGIASAPDELHLVDDSGEFSGLGEVKEEDLPVMKRWRPEKDEPYEFEIDAAAREKANRYSTEPMALSPLTIKKSEKEAEESATSYSSEPSEEEIEAVAGSGYVRKSNVASKPNE